MLHHLRLPIAATLLASSTLAAAQSNAWLEWVSANSPHGYDVTTDGTIWINLFKPGFRDDYAVRAGDLRAARQTVASNPKPKFWVRGYHINNKSVAYRETKVFYQIDCLNEQIIGLFAGYYDKNGNLMSQQSEQVFSPIVPGTYNAVFRQLFCTAIWPSLNEMIVPAK
jgi:hypothetical protein